MDPRLNEASHAGDLDALHRLLQQDRLLLDQLTTTPSNNPLHIAALLGYADFAREILERKPALAQDLNNHGLSPMHLASASGHLSVVKELLKEGGSELCLLRDKDGLLPIHSAAFKGRVQVLAELMEARPESAREVTYSRGDTVLHLAVKSHCFEAVKLLLERIDGDEAWLNSKDDKGNTILHLAVARRQHPTIKLLLAQPGIDVNAVNEKGLTALDALLELPGENGDLILGEMILAASTKNTGEGGGAREPAQTIPARATPSPDSVTRQQSNYTWISRLRQAAEWLGFHDPSRSRMDYRQLAKPPIDKSKRDRKLKQTLMLVATLIATITFQSGLSPPGGVDSKTGQAVLSDELNDFLIPDMIGLFASLSVILLFVCVDSSSQLLTKTLLWVMWVAVYSTALAFTTAAFHIFPGSVVVTVLLQCWGVILLITIFWIYLRFAVYVLRMVGWWKKTPRDGETTTTPPTPTGALLVIKRILVVVMAVGVPVAVNYATNLIEIPILSLCLLFISAVPMLWVCHRFFIYLLHKVGWCMEHRVEQSNPQQMTAALVTKRTLAITMIVATIGVVGVLYFFLYSKGVLSFA